MIVDTSALVAVINREPDHERIIDLLLDRKGAILLEARIVSVRQGGAPSGRRLDRLVSQAGITVVDFDAQQSDVALRAYAEYGKCSGHPAQLNFGDTFSYALASIRDEPLLYVGDDFSHTDLRPALESR